MPDGASGCGGVLPAPRRVAPQEALWETGAAGDFRDEIVCGSDESEARAAHLLRGRGAGLGPSSTGGGRVTWASGGDAAGSSPGERGG